LAPKTTQLAFGFEILAPKILNKKWMQKNIDEIDNRRGEANVCVRKYLKFSAKKGSAYRLTVHTSKDTRKYLKFSAKKGSAYRLTVHTSKDTSLIVLK